MSQGCWDSIHILEARDGGNGEGKYKLTTTVMLSMIVPDSDAGEVNLSGSLTRQASKTCKLDNVQTHIVNMGKMIEEMEITLRKQLDDLYIQRTRHIVNSIRKPYAPSSAKDGPSKNFLADLGTCFFFFYSRHQRCLKCWCLFVLLLLCLVLLLLSLAKHFF